MDEPLQPKIAAVVQLAGARASALQFRYLFVTDAQRPARRRRHRSPSAPRRVARRGVPLADAQRVYVARTYAYVAAGRDGLAIVDVEKPE